jgi:Na+-transporting NADH:ubiquinone oxidoreductase subunit NqrD
MAFRMQLLLDGLIAQQPVKMQVLGCCSQLSYETDHQ